MGFGASQCAEALKVLEAVHCEGVLRVRIWRQALRHPGSMTMGVLGQRARQYATS